MIEPGTRVRINQNYLDDSGSYEDTQFVGLTGVVTGTRTYVCVALDNPPADYGLDTFMATEEELDIL